MQEVFVIVETLQLYTSKKIMSFRNSSTLPYIIKVTSAKLNKNCFS